MADRVKKVDYCYISVPNRPGQGARLLGAIKDSGVTLLAYSGFPAKAGKAQLDLVAEKLAPLRKIAAKRINVTAADAVSAGKGRYGMILWVKPKDLGRAARALKAR
jgi:hypothetical protein